MVWIGPSLFFFQKFFYRLLQSIVYHIGETFVSIANLMTEAFDHIYKTYNGLNLHWENLRSVYNFMANIQMVALEC